MSDKSVFTDDEWLAVSEAPLLISMAMEAAGPHGPISITVSVGVAELKPADDNLDRLLARADGALYAAKTGGRNQVRVG